MVKKLTVKRRWLGVVLVGLALLGLVLFSKSDSKLVSLSLLGLFDRGEVAGSESVVVENPPQENFKALLKPILRKPRQLSIAKLGMGAVEIVPVGVSDAGRMEVPEKWDQVGWLQSSTALGGKGNIVLAGHYDDNFGRPAVFYRLGSLAEGDRIGVVGEGIPRFFAVTEVLPVSPDEAGVREAFRVFNDSTLTLITCGGVWDPGAASYNQRLLVRAKEVRMW